MVLQENDNGGVAESQHVWAMDDNTEQVHPPGFSPRRDYLSLQDEEEKPASLRTASTLPPPSTPTDYSQLHLETHEEDMMIEKEKAAIARSAKIQDCLSLEKKASFGSDLVEFLRWLLGVELAHKKWKRLHHEGEKIVISTKRFSVLQNLIFFHLPAVAVTATLLVLHFKTQLWPSSLPSSEGLSALQFAARIHETLVIVSLTDILLHRIRYNLLVEDGIPLGFLSSPYHLASPIPHLLSWEFISIAIILLLLISGGAGPLCAIAMVPRRELREIPYIESTLSSYDYVLASPSYDTMELASRHIPRVTRGTCVSTADPTCHKRDMSVLLQAYRSAWLQSRDGISGQNITSTAFGTELEHRPLTFWDNSTFSVALGPMEFLARSITGESDRLSDAGGDTGITVKARRKWKQPLVATWCTSFEISADNILQAPRRPFGHLSRTPLNHTMTKDLDFLREHEGDVRKNRTVNGFIELNQFLNVPVSAVFLSRVAANLSRPSWTKPRDDDPSICLIQARWVDGDAWRSKASVGTQIDIGVKLDEIGEYLWQTSNSSNVARLKAEWLNGIGSPDIIDPNVQNQAYAELAGFSFPVDRWTTAPLALYILDAMTRSVDMIEWHEVHNVTAENKATNPDYMAIDHDHLAYRYGYDFRGTSTKLAMLLLLAHVLIVFLHHGSTLLSSTPWQSSGWGSFGEMLALALRSRAPKGLHNVGGGSRSAKTWMTIVSIREVGEEGRLEVVIDDPEPQGAVWDNDRLSVGDGTQVIRRAAAGVAYK
ncbi:unnamed protein product [Clonostachys solani]|uniref:Uncharacterized protein n=1 Tax=Clonostachys solani TaxID=160281 RepID=A0A9P0ETB6_9HYPO|nr:unnamed protein product [Clonostachys solani]